MDAVKAERMELTRRLQEAIELHRKLQQDMQKHEQAIKQFMQQQNECEMVKKELDLLEDDNDVFKLVGPVLVKQDRMEAQSNVDKRLNFISNELSRAEGALQTVQEKRAKKESEIIRLQQDMQRLQAQPAA